MSITRNGSIITLENDFLRRVIDIEDGICTKRFHIRNGGQKQGDVWYPMFSFEESAPFEVAITINGVNYEACPFERNSQMDLWRRKGAFVVADAIIDKGQYGDTIDLVLHKRFDEMPDVELHIIYEVCDDMPFVSKKILVKNMGNNDVNVDHLTVDILRFFDRKISLSVFSNCYCEEHNEDFYYMGWTRVEFPTGMGMILGANEEFTSFDLYEAITGVDRQDESYVLHRIFKRIAPWIKQLNPTLTLASCTSMKELMQKANEARENGFEVVHLHVGQVFTNTGDYIPRSDIFPNGYDDVKILVDHFHKNGIKVFTYCSTTIAWRNTQVCTMHEDWQCLGPDGLRYEPGGFGNMCYHSPWGEYIKEKLFYLVDSVGFDGLALDGPVHGLVCEETNHKHRTPAAVNFMNWQWEREFYGEVVAKNKIIYAPEVWNALLLGICEIPAGYREEDQNEIGGLPFVTMTRSCVYESRYITPACCHWTSFNLDEYHGHSIEASEENPASYEHSVAGVFGYGFDGTVFAKNIFIGEKTKAIYFKWLGIFKQYKETFLGEFIHLQQPTGYAPDGVMHANPDADVPALAVFFNPTDKLQEWHLTLPLRYANIEQESTVIIEGQSIKTDSLSNAQFKVRLKPYEVTAIPVLRA